MTDKELKRLRRSDLLEMLLALSKENAQLRNQLEQTRRQLDDRILTVSEAGNLSDAVLQLNGVFDATHKACAQYEENIRARCEEMEQDTQKKCDTLITAAKKHAARILQSQTATNNSKQE